MQRSPLPGQEGNPIPRPTIPTSEIWLMQHSYIYAHYRIWNKIQQLGSPNDFSKGNWQDELRLFTTTGQKRQQQLRTHSKRALQELRDYTRQQNIELMVAVAPPAFVIHPERLEATFKLVDQGKPRRCLRTTANGPQLTREYAFPMIDPCTAEGYVPALFDGHLTQKAIPSLLCHSAMLGIKCHLFDSIDMVGMLPTPSESPTIACPRLWFHTNTIKSNNTQQKFTASI